jgi:NAD(P)-dependent dehydrogenase (short-subunit alcohol dehydrogenase family)
MVEISATMTAFDLQGKHILVTGASSGIGRGVATQLASVGARLTVVGRNEERLRGVLKALEGMVPKPPTKAAGDAAGQVATTMSSKDELGVHARTHRMIVGDLTNNAHRLAILDSLEEGGPLDGLVHAAGQIKLVPFQFQHEAEMRALMEVNYFAPVQLVHALLKGKKLRKGGSVVLISSITGSHGGTGGGTIYGSSKGALEGLVRSLAVELGRSKIRVNTIAPGLIETEAVAALRDLLSPEAMEKDVRRYPLGRIGSTVDVALAAQYLLSDASTWVTGTRLVVDGGLSAQA